MKRKWLFISTVILVVGMLVFKDFYRSKAQTEQKKVTVYLAGDSTVSNYPLSKSPKAGWGQMIEGMFDEQVVVKNVAVPGRSSKSFIAEGRLDTLLKQIQPGDYLFIQFGHNDQKIQDPSRYTEPNTTYKEYLKTYIDGARKRGAIPILITPVERRSFTEDGQVMDTHGEYPSAMKELGREEKVRVIDLTAKSKIYFQQLGPDQTKELFLFLDPGVSNNYPSGIADNVHFQKKGAKEIAKLVVEGIKELSLPLSKHIRSDK
ncbi:rhamnogalacturonan acetylesterase [Neobacillus sp. D3-1R]|uniref:rhamnogalacturonan acetylesterase n=1 Tax=Neobacillus sp. D3-1R TaxID=3445778 RepID=UPI003F9F3336